MNTAQDTREYAVQDQNLPYLETAWSAEGSLAFLNSTVLPQTNIGRRAVSVEIDTMNYKPGRKCVVLYEYVLEGDSEAASRWAVATFMKDDRLSDVHRRTYEGADDDSDLAQRAVYAPDYRALVEFFPNDWELPSLVDVVDPGRVAEPLGAGLLGVAHDRNGARRPEASVLRYRPHERCVIRYAWDANDGNAPTVIIGKVFSDALEALAAGPATRLLEAKANTRGLLLPKPVGQIPEWNLLLMESLRGKAMNKILKRASSKREALAAIRPAVEALVSLHRLDIGEVANRPSRTMPNEFERVEKRATRLPLVAPELGHRAQSLLEQLHIRAHDLPSPTDALIHGDFKPSQLLLEDGRVGVVDLDRACPGDSALDVGNFMAQLRKEALSTGNAFLRELSPIYLDEYQRRIRRPALAERAQLYQALALVRIAVRAFGRWPYRYERSGPASFPALLLEEAAACLSDR